MKKQRSRKAIFSYQFALVAAAICLQPGVAAAICNSCYLPRANRDQTYSLGADRPGFFADLRFEYQDWKTEGNTEGDSSHHEKQASSSDSNDSAAEDHGHNRAREQYSHLTLGFNISNSLTVFTHAAYVQRFELTDEGIQETSGISDTDLVGIWRFHRFNSGYLGGLFGTKLPTGDSHRRDSAGELFQPELQPGTGSVDFSVGPLFEAQSPPFIFRGNILYFLRNGGSQNYTFGNATSSSLFVDYVLQESKAWSLYFGADTNLQLLNRDRQNGQAVEDSGGTLLFFGPNITLRLGESFLTSAAVLFPVIQNRGGEHQDLGHVLTIGGRFLF